MENILFHIDIDGLMVSEKHISIRGEIMDYKFQELEERLKIGQEIEFEYNNKKYSITNWDGHWWICNDTDHITLVKVNHRSKDGYKNLIQELLKPYIENKSIKEIFDNLEYNSDSLYIL